MTHSAETLTTHVSYAWPSYVVTITRSNRSLQPTICPDLDVERQVEWFDGKLIERLGGKQACALLLKELDA